MTQLKKSKQLCIISFPIQARFLRTLKKIKEFCKNSDITIVFSPFKTGKLFSSKDCLPNGLKSYVAYKFVYAECQSCYIGETRRHLPTKISEHLLTDKKSNIFKRLLENPTC